MSGSLTQVGTPTGRLTARIDALLEDLRKAASRTREGSDPESIHDLRVTLRRLDAVLDVVRDALVPRRRRRARAAMRALRRRLGPAREAEVLVAGLQTRLGEAPPETLVVATAALEHLTGRAKRRRRDAARRSGRKVIDRIARRVRRACRPVVRAAEAPDQWVAGARARSDRRASEAMASITTALRNPGEDDLHAARIAIKRWRYAQEWLPEGDAQDHAARQAWLRSVQTSLGEIHDLAALREALGRFEQRLRVADPRAGGGLRPLRDGIERERRRELEGLMRRFAPALVPRTAETARAGTR